MSENENNRNENEIEKVEDKDVHVEEKKKDDGYEKFCFICHRPESVTGKLIDLPNNISVCSDCMQKSFDAMTSGQIDYSKLMNIPGVQIFNMSDLENAAPRQQKVKKKTLYILLPDYRAVQSLTASIHHFQESLPGNQRFS